MWPDIENPSEAQFFCNFRSQKSDYFTAVIYNINYLVIIAVTSLFRTFKSHKLYVTHDEQLIIDKPFFFIFKTYYILFEKI